MGWLRLASVQVPIAAIEAILVAWPTRTIESDVDCVSILLSVSESDVSLWGLFGLCSNKSLCVSCIRDLVRPCSFLLEVLTATALFCALISSGTLQLVSSMFIVGLLCAIKNTASSRINIILDLFLMRANILAVLKNFNPSGIKCDAFHAFS